MDTTLQQDATATLPHEGWSTVVMGAFYGILFDTFFVMVIALYHLHLGMYGVQIGFLLTVASFAMLAGWMHHHHRPRLLSAFITSVFSTLLVTLLLAGSCYAYFLRLI